MCCKGSARVCSPERSPVHSLTWGVGASYIGAMFPVHRGRLTLLQALSGSESSNILAAGRERPETAGGALSPETGWCPQLGWQPEPGLRAARSLQSAGVPGTKAKWLAGTASQA